MAFGNHTNNFVAFFMELSHTIFECCLFLKEALYGMYEAYVNCCFETLAISKWASKSDGRFETFFRFSFGLALLKSFLWLRRLPMIYSPLNSPFFLQSYEFTSSTKWCMTLLCSIKSCRAFLQKSFSLFGFCPQYFHPNH